MRMIRLSNLTPICFYTGPVCTIAEAQGKRFPVDVNGPSQIGWFLDTETDLVIRSVKSGSKLMKIVSLNDFYGYGTSVEAAISEFDKKKDKHGFEIGSNIALEVVATLSANPFEHACFENEWRHVEPGLILCTAADYSDIQNVNQSVDWNSDDPKYRRVPSFEQKQLTIVTVCRSCDALDDRNEMAKQAAIRLKGAAEAFQRGFGKPMTFGDIKEQAS